ncbi:hypothetical protein SAMN02799624_02073 [Paenibacillus sp. UNC496MF]|uniref:hypothetical protein n=1 Tax=Paenibacillus sp. UNC496MF TaxID=1502753 RepID=UPI0008E8998F|nr:hypothetical protein [Paenibacillus sp. UNC496MF]SFI76419.1 hypothetical protein SAMN02799624_02073 [Paenibacillus sp. UNC496MF]
MNVLPNIVRAISALATLGALLLLGVAFLFNDTGEPASTLLAIYGGYALIGLSVFVGNEILIGKRAFAHRPVRRAYRIFWACVALAGLCVWAAVAYR